MFEAGKRVRTTDLPESSDYAAGFLADRTGTVVEDVWSMLGLVPVVLDGFDYSVIDDEGGDAGFHVFFPAELDPID